MKIKITGIIIMVIFAGTLIFYTCGKSQPQTDNQIYIGVACYDQKDTFIEELVDAFKEQCSSMESKDYAISMTIMDASLWEERRNNLASCRENLQQTLLKSIRRQTAIMTGRSNMLFWKEKWVTRMQLFVPKAW